MVRGQIKLSFVDCNEELEFYFKYEEKPFKIFKQKDDMI